MQAKRQDRSEAQGRIEAKHKDEIRHIQKEETIIEPNQMQAKRLAKWSNVLVWIEAKRRE